MAQGARETVLARAIVNAAGPWVGDVAANLFPKRAQAPVRLVQGSHIVVPKLYAHERCYMLQNDDRRIVFAIPYERDFTLIGTTDRDFSGDPARVSIAADEVGYLCAAANAAFTRAIRPSDVRVVL